MRMIRKKEEMLSYLIAPLGNFTSTTKIIIEDDLWIEPLKPHIELVTLKAFESRLIRHSCDFSHCIVYSNFNENEDNSREIMEKLLTTLRIFQDGDVYYNFAIIDKNGWYDNPVASLTIDQFAIFFFVCWDHMGLKSNYSINDSNVNSFKDFVKTFWKDPVLVTTPFHFFFKAYHEPYTEHRFLNYSIALENILVNDSDDSSNINYKFIDRGLFLLEKNKLFTELEIDKKVLILKEIYKTRSDIVHSSKRNRNWQEDKYVKQLVHIDMITRKFLNNLLIDKEIRISTNIDKEKRKRYL